MGKLKPKGSSKPRRRQSKTKRTSNQGSGLSQYRSGLGTWQPPEEPLAPQKEKIIMNKRGSKPELKTEYTENYTKSELKKLFAQHKTLAGNDIENMHMVRIGNKDPKKNSGRGEILPALSAININSEWNKEYRPPDMQFSGVLNGNRPSSTSSTT